MSGFCICDAMSASTGWKSATDDKGRTYYYNVETGESRWDKPQDLFTEEELVLLKHGWKSSKTPEGRTYYYNVETKESRWDMPTFAEVQEEQPEQKQDVPKTVSPEKTEVGNEDYANTSGIFNPPKKSKEEAESEFLQMLQDNQVDSTWSFGKIISQLGSKDSRYWMVDDDPLWKQQIFERYLSNRTEEQLLKEHTEISKFKDAFWEMLKGKQQIHYYTRWPTARRIIANEPIYKHSVIKESVKKKTFVEYVKTLAEKRQKELIQLKEQALRELEEYLKGIMRAEAEHENTLLPVVSWQNLLDNYLFEKNKRYVANKHFAVLSHEDVLQVYLNIVATTEDSMRAKLLELQEKNYTKDRIARDKFKELLRSPKLRIKANSKWQDIYPIIKNEPQFQNMLGTGGSSALDLFLDVVEEKSITMAAHRSIAQTLLIDKGFKWHEDHDVNALTIRNLLIEDDRFQSLDSDDIELIIELLIELKKEKQREQKEAEDRIAQQKRHFFKLMLHRFYRGPKVRPDSWEDARADVQDTVEFRELGDDDKIREALFEEFKKSTPRDATRTAAATVQPTRKRPLSPPAQLDY